MVVLMAVLMAALLVNLTVPVSGLKLVESKVVLMASLMVDHWVA